MAPSPLLLLSSLLPAALAIGDTAALLQSTVQVHNATAKAEVQAHFLADNSALKHNGPGILFRKTQRLQDTVNASFYMPWGTTFEGQPAGEGWVKSHRGGKDYFLPLTLQGARVLTLQHISTKGHLPAQPGRYHYARTELQMLGGRRFPCRILRKGRVPGTYDAEVTPERFAAYNVTGVPAANFTRVRRIREFDTVSPHAAQVRMAQRVSSEGTVHLTVNNTKDSDVFRIKMLRKSPFRTAMKMACERASINWYGCHKRVRFLRESSGVRLHPDNTTGSLDLKDGETITMLVRLP